MAAENHTVTNQSEILFHFDVGALCGAEAGPAAACVGLIPGLIGVTLLVYVLFLAAPLPESTVPEQESLRE